ncbi:hypothetical protein WJX74_007323 [Apatococcus lobatus]|uniref:B box-type domain-containing protein n=2 Tax=Apatococcus TaxID=904362 RepID=A0AAW1SMD7_9CHLO
MGLTCDVCEKEAGTAYCFADRALMCSACDMRVHSANKLAKKHDRVSVSVESESVPCDICQEEKAVMFCPEERAVTCRRCDIMIHTANEFTAKHRRSLLSTTTMGLDSLPAPGEAPIAPAVKQKATGHSIKEQDTSTSSDSPLGASTDGGTGSDAAPASTGRGRSRRGKAAAAEAGETGVKGSSGQLLDNRMGLQGGGATLLNSSAPNGVVHQPQMNGNPAMQHSSEPSNNGVPGSNSSYPSQPPQSGFQTSPFQFNSLPYQDTPRSSSMQQHQPGGPGQPDGMFASSFPPGADTSGVPNGSGFDYGARAHSTGMWRASSTNSVGMTLAAELLGVPLPDEYSAKDIDAAYMMGDDGDLDADLSALLEVPDLNSTDLASLGPSMTPAALASSFSPGASGSGHNADGVVPDMAGPSKRQRR